MPTLAQLQEYLEEAETALHKLNTGSLEVEVAIGGFGRTEFNKVNINELEKYISRLKEQIALKEGRRRRRPILMRF